jgi:hypothetical protein
MLNSEASFSYFSMLSGTPVDVSKISKILYVFALNFGGFSLKCKAKQSR